MMFAIGAGDQLVAVDEFSDHPAEAQTLPNELSAFDNQRRGDRRLRARPGADRWRLQRSRAATRRRSTSAGGTAPQPARSTTRYAQIEQLGAATGHVGRGGRAGRVDAGRDRRDRGGDAAARRAADRTTTSSTTRCSHVDSTTLSSVQLYGADRAREHRRHARGRPGRLPAAERGVHRRRPTPT